MVEVAVYTHIEYIIDFFFQHFDGAMRRCERWLGKNYPNEFHIVDELHGTPTHKRPVAARPAPPMRLPVVVHRDKPAATKP